MPDQSIRHQRLRALEDANRTRTRRKLLKDALRKRRIRPDAMLRTPTPPDWLATAQIAEMLRQVHGLGPSTVGLAFKVCRLPEQLTFGSSSLEQRERIHEYLMRGSGRYRTAVLQSIAQPDQPSQEVPDGPTDRTPDQPDRAAQAADPGVTA